MSARTTRTTALASVAALAGALALGACSSEQPSDDAPAPSGITVSGAYVPEPMMKDMAAGFFTVKNTGDTADTLTKVTTDAAAEAELHETVDRKMQQVDSFRVPANGTLRLSRGGNHLMLMGLDHKPAEGDSVTLTLHFEHHKPVTVTAPVKASNHNPNR
ncbi:copper chaperone PCu(A)C [Streptomyces sp. TR02-1]|uniref:copper chaperone PCu(A)C n=1 Tax=Streptomyces sp. TR02-1 TaxID=3385977 RepID=UPI0039A291BC